MNRLETNFCSVNFKNPLILPSGIIQEIPAHIKAEKAGAGGITTKTLTVRPRQGNPLPWIIKYDCGYLNSVGLRNPGLKEGVKQLEKLITTTKIPVIVSIFAVSIKEFKELAEAVEEIRPTFIELNLSCPNTTNELGQPLGMGVESTMKVVKTVKKSIDSKIKLIAKLSPNVQNIKEIARAAQTAGVNAISAINTVGPGMVIDINKRRPLLGNKEGGLSGPGIKPIAIRCIYDIFEAVNIPIIGMGGISTWQDAAEMMMAGASLVGVGSAIYFQGYKVFEEIKRGINSFLIKEKYGNVSKLVGLAH